MTTPQKTSHHRTRHHRDDTIKATCKWFNDAKGFGFLVCDEHDEDIFVHHSDIAMEGYKKLDTDQAVHAAIERGPRGLYAEKCWPE